MCPFQIGLGGGVLFEVDGLARSGSTHRLEGGGFDRLPTRVHLWNTSCPSMFFQIKAIAHLKSRIAELFSIFDTIKEPVKSPFEAQQHILKHLTMNVVVLRSDFFNLR